MQKAHVYKTSSMPIDQCCSVFDKSFELNVLLFYSSSNTQVGGNLYFCGYDEQAETISAKSTPFPTKISYPEAMDQPKYCFKATCILVIMQVNGTAQC